MSAHLFRQDVAAVAALFATAILGCTTDHALTDVGAASPAFRRVYTALAQATFTVGPLVITGIDQTFPGQNWHLRDVLLSGPVSGDLSGTAYLSLNANLDGILGSGPAWGTMTIVTADGDEWIGELTGHFASGAPLGIQLFSRVILRGDHGQTFEVECDETSVTSETLICEPRL